MPTIEGHLDDQGMPFIDLRILPAQTAMATLIDTGFDGDLLVYYDDLRRIGVEVAADRIVQARLADGSDATLLGAVLTIDWFGEPQRVRADIVPDSACQCTPSHRLPPSPRQPPGDRLHARDGCSVTRLRSCLNVARGSQPDGWVETSSWYDAVWSSLV